MPRIATILKRRDTAANWASTNPILQDGEIGYDKTNKREKTGDGVTAWNDLSYDTATDPIAVNSANNALAVATAATNTASTASAQASGAVTTANAATTAVAAKATLQVGALAASTSVAPNAQAVIDHVATQISGVTAGSSALVATTYAAAISLDKTQGRDMGYFVQTADIDFTVAGSPTPVNNGSCNLVLYTDDTHTITASGFTLMNGLSLENGRIYDLSFLRNGAGQYRLYGADAGAVDVTPPTLVSAIVANSTPTHIDLTWSEPINSAIPAASAFTASGKTVTAHTYVDPTHTYLTVSAAFTFGATSNLGYTVPGSNPIKDLAVTPNLGLGITGRAITNNVAASSTGSLVITTVTPANEDLTVGYEDYYVVYGSSPVVRKTGGTTLTGPTFVNSLTKQAWTSATGSVTLTQQSGTSPEQTGYDTAAAANGKLQFTVPADTTPHRIRVWFGEGCTLRATLTDVSDTEKTSTIASGSKGVRDITFNGAGSTTLTISLECSGATFFTFQAIAYEATA